MPDLTDRGLDDLLREGAEMQEFSYNEEAWQDVSSRLDKQDRKRRLIMFIFTLIGLLLILSFLWKHFDSDDNAIDNLTSDKKVNMDIIPLQAENSILEINAETKELDSQPHEDVPAASLNALNSNALTEDYSSKVNPISTTNSIDPPLNSDLFNERKSLTVENYSSLNKDSSVLGDISENTIINSRQNENSAFISLIKFQPLSDDAKLISFQNSVPVLLQSLAVKNTSSKKSTHGLIIALAAGTEWSSVQMEPLGKVGSKFEVKLGYQFGKRFELSTGLAYAKKMFQTSGSTFMADEGIWTDNVVPETLYGEDDVIEIPLDLTYYLSGYNKSGLFANVGLRSYMMHEENFNFVYSQAQVKPGLISSYTMIDEHEHWLGILRFGLGYQYRIGKYYSVQLSPYVQVPISDIGHGNQRLYSAGIQIATRFNMR